MITKAMVLNTLRRWESAGLKPPANSAAKASFMVEEFLERFQHMDEETLEYVAKKLSLSNVWPTFSVIAQVAQEYKEQHSQYVYIDYYGELEKRAMGERMSFEEFIQEVAKKHFPDKSEEWRKRHAFTLHFFGVRLQACKECKGSCPHNGHQYFLRMKKGTDLVVPWASMDLCPRYKESVDGRGRVYKHKQKDNWQLKEEEMELPEELMPPAKANKLPFATKGIKKPKLIDQDLFSQEVEA